MSDKLSIDKKTVQELAEILISAGINEIEYQQGDARVRLAKEVGSSTFPTITHFQKSISKEINVSVPELESVRSGSAIKNENITAPMVGTIYLSPDPGAPPFVRVGDHITEGQVLFIIEAMKVMNQVRSPKAGVVAEICVEDSEPVEFGQPLLYFS